MEKLYVWQKLSLYKVNWSDFDGHGSKVHVTMSYCTRLPCGACALPPIYTTSWNTRALKERDQWMGLGLGPSIQFVNAQSDNLWIVVLGYTNKIWFDLIWLIGPCIVSTVPELNHIRATKDLKKLSSSIWNWGIGKSWGAHALSAIPNFNYTITIYTNHIYTGTILVPFGLRLGGLGRSPVALCRPGGLPLPHQLQGGYWGPGQFPGLCWHGLGLHRGRWPGSWPSSCLGPRNVVQLPSLSLVAYHNQWKT